MQIAIDYTAGVRQMAGVGRYTRGLVRALLDVGQQHRFTLLYAGLPPDVWPGPELDGRQARALPLLVPERAVDVLWHRWRLPIYADMLAGGADLFFGPNYALPPLRRAAGVVAVYDLSYLTLPETHEPELRHYLGTVVPLAVRDASLVVTDSEFARRQIVEQLGVAEERTIAVPAAPEPTFRIIGDTAARAGIRQRYQLDRPFILSVGTIQPRKNLVRLLEAIARLRWHFRDSALLVHVGRRGWLYGDVFRAVQDLRLSDVVRLVDGADDWELALLYNEATVLALPSLYEGFGIPCVEAMVCGVPVVASNVASLPEVVGDAGILIDPYDVDGLADALHRCLNDESLRGDLIRRGMERARRFNWERSAVRLLAAFDRCVDQARKGS